MLDVERASPLLLFYRSVTQLAGGAGLAIIMLSTVSISVGITAPDAPAVVLWVMMAAMFLGRLEFFAVVVGLLRLSGDVPTLVSAALKLPRSSPRLAETGSVLRDDSHAQGNHKRSDRSKGTIKYKYVFLLGRAGCGKSALYRELEKQLLESGRAKTFERVDDFPKIWAKFQEDNALEKEGKERIYSKRTDDGDYLVTNDNIWNDVLKEVNSDALKINKPDHMIFFEFARTKYVAAIQNFDKSILDRCIVIYIRVSFDICWARNVARHKVAIAEGGDDHLVSREEMEKTFLHDDQDAFVQYMKDQNIPVLVVNNEADGEEHLQKQVKELVKNLF